MSAPFHVHPSLGLALALFLAACGGQGDQPTTTDPVPEPAPAEQGDQLLRVGGRVFSVPSPIQSALAIRNAGLGYNREATLALEQGSTLTGRTEQALALGMYGADLAYATTHEDGQRVLATLQVIEKLAGDLELGNAFDKDLLESFRDNLSNEDSLLRFSGAAFRAADEYLKTNERDEVSALVLAGGWLEALHLTLSDPAAAGSQVIVDRVGEQRTTLDGLVATLEEMGAEGRAADLLKGLKDISSDFDDIRTSYTFEPPVTDREARTTYINSTTSVQVSPEKLAAIAQKVASLRSSILA